MQLSKLLHRFGQPVLVTSFLYFNFYNFSNSTNNVGHSFTFRLKKTCNFKQFCWKVCYLKENISKKSFLKDLSLMFFCIKIGSISLLLKFFLSIPINKLPCSRWLYWIRKGFHHWLFYCLDLLDKRRIKVYRASLKQFFLTVL